VAKLEHPVLRRRGCEVEEVGGRLVEDPRPPGLEQRLAALAFDVAEQQRIGNIGRPARCPDADLRGPLRAG
jgi:hypothetical protein